MSLATAIKSYWESTQLPSLIPGGLWNEKAPTGTTFPYQVFIVLGQAHTGRTSHSTRRRAAFEIHTFYKTQTGKDPQAEVDSLVTATDNAFDEAILTLTDKSTMLCTQNDQRTFEEDSQVYRGLNEFDLLVIKTRT